ncbi:NADPH-dependent F420 reductase [Saccharopolyspora spinosa]|uniref:NADPH-dependent F420 reductase n=1 Tax=Saccharopolyspora spinosa TaxID=60894 RepID=UPI0002378B89|nr:NAD(P)-binding domain-containing protein [Saccharopolyspora spinosa]
MADALGTQWTRAGHQVLVGGRDPAKTRVLADRLGSSTQSGTFAEAAEFGDVVLVAVLHPAAADVLSAGGAEAGALRGKALIDCTNAVVPIASSSIAPSARRSPNRSPSRRSGRDVVKAFDTCHQSVWRLTPPVFDGRPLVVPLCGDDPDAIATDRSLVTNIGCEPGDGGRLEHAAPLEATTRS